MTVDRRALRKSLRTNFQPGPRDYLNRAALRARQAAHLPGYAAGRSLDRPVFIVGAPRSGTSLLYSVLRAAPVFAHWPGEAHEVWEADYHPALRGWSSNALTAADVEPKAAQRIRRSFFLVAGSRRRLIDKTPRNALRVSFVDAIFPDARYVYLVRDGRENVNSLINAWRTPRYRTYRLRHSVEGVDPDWWKFVLYPGWQDDSAGPLEVVCARQWAASNEHALRDLSAVGGRAARVRYEDLVDSPEDEVARVLDFLEVPFDGALREKAAAVRTTPVNVVTPPERGKWRKENPREIESIVPLITPAMEALGYEV
ncbi:MAG TPA: sulfotransferase [Actinomycetota bacterium]|nr:sulfotransferase [Actinomycetota bacterium]